MEKSEVDGVVKDVGEKIASILLEEYKKGNVVVLTLPGYLPLKKPPYYYEEDPKKKMIRLLDINDRYIENIWGYIQNIVSSADEIDENAIAKYVTNKYLEYFKDKKMKQIDEIKNKINRFNRVEFDEKDIMEHRVNPGFTYIYSHPSEGPIQVIVRIINVAPYVSASYKFMSSRKHTYELDIPSYRPPEKESIKIFITEKNPFRMPNFIFLATTNGETYVVYDRGTHTKYYINVHGIPAMDEILTDFEEKFFGDETFKMDEKCMKINNLLEEFRELTRDLGEVSKYAGAALEYIGNNWKEWEG